MDEISTSLQPYKGIIGASAIYSAIAANLAGTVTCRRIHKKGNTNNETSLIFVTNVMLSLIKYRIGYMLEDDILMSLNTAIILLNSLYCLFFYIYANDKWNDIIKQFSFCLGIVAVLWRYSEWEDPTLVKFRYGLIGAILTLSLMLGPAKATKNIFENKDASQISLLWTTLSFLFAFSMVLYSLVRNIKLMLIQGGAAFLLSSVRLFLIFKYPSKPTKSNKKKKPKSNKKKLQ